MADNFVREKVKTGYFLVALISAIRPAPREPLQVVAVGQSHALVIRNLLIHIGAMGKTANFAFGNG
jgi:hypothetical protein